MRSQTLRRSWALLLLLCYPVSASPPGGVNLASLEGWGIVVAQNASPSATYAAEEFQHHVTTAMGHTLPITTSIDRPERHVFIGPGELIRESGLGYAIDDFGPEDLRIRMRDDNVVIAGDQPRGTLYGVYTFLEDYLCVRFLTRDHTHVPSVGQWRVVGPVDRFYHPPLDMRYSYYGEINGNAVFAARSRVNTVGDDLKLGGWSQQRLKKKLWP